MLLKNESLTNLLWKMLSDVKVKKPMCEPVTIIRIVIGVQKNVKCSIIIALRGLWTEIYHYQDMNVFSIYDVKYSIRIAVGCLWTEISAY